MFLGKLTFPGRPRTSMLIEQEPIACAVSSGWSCLDILLSSIFSLLFLSLSGRRPDID